MRALFLLPLLAGCATAQPVDVVPLDGRYGMHGTITPAMVAEQTTARREAMALAEHAYTGAIMAAEMALPLMDEEELRTLTYREARAGDALAYLRTFDDADEQSFVWALHFYNVAIADLNRLVEGGEAETYHAH